MENAKSWVVLENKGAMGVTMIRHPYATREAAEDRARNEADKRPGTVLYTAMMEKKFEGVTRVKVTDLD